MKHRALVPSLARVVLCLVPLAGATAAEKPIIQRLAGATITVANLEKTREFYTGLLGLEEAFDLKDASGTVKSAFFKINDEQYLEFATGAVEGFRLDRISLLTAGLQQTAAELRRRGIPPGEISKAADGTAGVAFRDPGGMEVRFVSYVPGSRQNALRGKALGARRVSDHLQHMGVAADNEAANMQFYQAGLGMRELFRGGMIPGETRWINLVAPETPGDIIELMILASAPAQGRRHVAFEVPDMQRAYKQLRDRGLAATTKPNAGPKANPRWILNLRDPNGLRVEIMGEMVPVAQRN